MAALRQSYQLQACSKQPGDVIVPLVLSQLTKLRNLLCSRTKTKKEGKTSTPTQSDGNESAHLSAVTLVRQKSHMRGYQTLGTPPTTILKDIVNINRCSCVLTPTVNSCPQQPYLHSQDGFYLLFPLLHSSGEVGFLPVSLNSFYRSFLYRQIQPSRKAHCSIFSSSLLVN